VIHGEFFEGTYLDNITFNDKDILRRFEMGA
jgi:hypothetical protein